MYLKCSIFVILFISSVIGSENVNGSFWDTLPLISQISSAKYPPDVLQSARKTQENFLNQALLFSQIKLPMSNDEEVPRKTQEQFLGEFLEPLGDHTPIIGHIKGAIHMATGDENIAKKKQELLKSLTLDAEPAGAIAGAGASDTIITGISIEKDDFKPRGIVDYFAKILGDQIIGIDSEFAVGKGAQKEKDDVKKDDRLHDSDHISEHHIDADSPEHSRTNNSDNEGDL